MQGEVPEDPLLVAVGLVFIEKRLHRSRSPLAFEIQKLVHGGTIEQLSPIGQKCLSKLRGSYRYRKVYSVVNPLLLLVFPFYLQFDVFQTLFLED